MDDLVILRPKEALRESLYAPYGVDPPLFKSGIDLAQAITGEGPDHVRTRSMAARISETINLRKRIRPDLILQIMRAANERLGQTPAERREQRGNVLEYRLTTLFLDMDLPIESSERAYMRFRAAIRSTWEFFFYEPDLYPNWKPSPMDTVLDELAERFMPASPHGPASSIKPPRVTLCYASRSDAELLYRELFFYYTGRTAFPFLASPWTDGQALELLRILEAQQLLRVRAVSGAPCSPSTFIFTPHHTVASAYHLYYNESGQISICRIPLVHGDTLVKSLVWGVERETLPVEAVSWSDVEEAVVAMAQAVSPEQVAEHRNSDATDEPQS